MKAEREPVRMVVLNTWRQESEVVGFHGVPNRLEPVLRMPGEPMAALVKRTLHQVRGAGGLVVYPIFRNLENHSKV